MSKKTASHTMEDLMQMRTRAGDTDSAEMDGLLAEMIELKKTVDYQNKLIHSLEEDAMTDPLTKLVNRRVFEQELVRSLASAKRYNRQHALLMIDVNGFKDINDNLGHSTGDRVLQHIAQLVKQNTRPTDVVARYGGDEFCVILNDIRAAENGMERAKALSDLIALTPCATDKGTITVQLSIGAYAFGASDELKEVIAKADKSMYDIKQTAPRSIF